MRTRSVKPLPDQASSAPRFAFGRRSAVVAPAEARLGSIAAGMLSASMLLVAGFFFAAFASITQTWQAIPSAAVVVMYFLQIHFLSTVGRRPARQRLRIWQLSLLAHAVAFAAAYLVVRDSWIFVLLFPEAISALLHLFGIRHAARSLQRC